MEGIGIQITLVVVLLLVNGVLAGSEIALISLRESQIARGHSGQANTLANRSTAHGHFVVLGPGERLPMSDLGLVVTALSRRGVLRCRRIHVGEGKGENREHRET